MHSQLPGRCYDFYIRIKQLQIRIFRSKILQPHSSLPPASAAALHYLNQTRCQRTQQSFSELILMGFQSAEQGGEKRMNLEEQMEAAHLAHHPVLCNGAFFLFLRAGYSHFFLLCLVTCIFLILLL